MNLHATPRSRDCIVYIALLTTVALWLGAGPATAAPKVGSVRAMALEGKKLFRQKKFKAAAKRFMDAYEVAPKPPLVFNAARAYEEAGMRREAARLFRLYLSVSKSKRGRAKARVHLRALKKEPRKPAPAIDGSASVQPPGSTSMINGGATPKPSWSRWVITGVAVALAGAGGIMLSTGSSDSDEVAQMDVRTRDDIEAYNSRFDRAERLWWGGAITGATALGFGVWAVIEHLRAMPSQHALRLDLGPRTLQATVHF